MTFEREAYLARVDLDDFGSGPEGLQAIQAAQMASIPFENIDPLLGRVPFLDPERLQRKLLDEKRGGYCFELNGLLGAALKAAGYEFRIVLARVRNGAAEGGARTHQAFLVETGGTEWLVDAGFGGPGSIWPLRTDTQESQKVPNGTYRLRTDSASGESVLERQSDRGWTALYGYEPIHVRSIDLAAANHLCATWEQAPFRAHLMMAMTGPESRVSLFNRKFQIGGVSQVLAGAGDLARALRDAFGVHVSGDTNIAIWERIKNQPTERPI